MEQRDLRMLLVGAAVVLLLVGTLTPWWTWESHVSGSGSMFGDLDTTSSESAGPFDEGDPDDGGMIEGGQATMTGILLILALVLAAATLALALVPGIGAPVRALAPFGAAIAAVLGLLLVILAPTTWPSNDIKFWDHQTQTSGGFTAELNTWAGAGWYLTLAAVLVLGYVAVTGFLAAQATPTDGGSKAAKPAKPAKEAKGAKAAPAKAAKTAGKCQATTKSGAPCTRNATNGKFCATHA